MSSMTSNKPYMVRAVYDWVLDNACTPHLVLVAEYPGTEVPQDFVRDGQLTLNISPSAVRDLNIGNESVTFNARFGGMPMDIVVPIGAVVAVFAKENGQGMGFEVEPPEDPIEPDDNSGDKKPGLRVVK